jgi:glycosyltransferase involved in cell wall biosynthesis
MSKRKIVCFGPGPEFKGGISNYNTSLAKAFDKMDDVEVHIISWTQQYPAIVPREFKDKTSKVDLLKGTDVKIQYITNYNKPSTWRQTAKAIIEINPEVVIFQWYNAQQGLPLGKIAKRIKKAGIECLFDLHFVVPKENSKIDAKFTKMGLKHASSFIVHALKTHEELKSLFPDKKFQLTYDGKRDKDATDKFSIKLYHPVYDLFQPNPEFDVAKFKADNNLKKYVFLYFGFIRKYKGLHNVIDSFKILSDKRDDVSLIICGESFWNTLDNSKFSTKVKNVLFGIAKAAFLKKEDDEKNYNPLELLDKHNLRDNVMLVNEFVANEEVHKYFQVSDCGLLFYLTATPSGVESLNYNFKLPVIATNVGHFPETIEDRVNGYLTKENDIEDMAIQMNRFIEHPIDRDNITEKTKEFSWVNYCTAILNR